VAYGIYFDRKISLGVKISPQKKKIGGGGGGGGGGGALPSTAHYSALCACVRVLTKGAKN
jgi:hypothetical protein